MIQEDGTSSATKCYLFKIRIHIRLASLITLTHESIHTYPHPHMYTATTYTHNSITLFLPEALPD